MAYFRKPTEMLPATVVQELRMVVGPELGAPAQSYRVVQMLIPANGVVRAGVTPDPRFTVEDGEELLDGVPNLAEQIGYDRTYKLAVVPSGVYMPVKLLPNQSLWAASEQGVVELAVVIEYRMMVVAP